MYKIIRQDIDKKTGKAAPNSTYSGRALGLRFDNGQTFAEQLNATHLFHLNRWSPRYRVQRQVNGEWSDVNLGEELRAARASALAAANPATQETTTEATEPAPVDVDEAVSDAVKDVTVVAGSEKDADSAKSSKGKK